MFADPARSKPVAAPQPCAVAAVPDRSGTRLRILLVDDNPTFSAAVHKYLDMVPDVQIVGQAHDGKSALALVRGAAPQLVVLDIAMPGMNGLELARALRAMPQPAEIVFLSMHDNREYRHAAAELGAHFVSKADFVADLLPLLERLVQAQRHREPRHGDPDATGGTDR